MPTGILDVEATDDANGRTDARRTWCALTAFQRDILITIRAFGASGHAPKGLEILDVLGSERAETINHGRLYPNLDTLADAGLIDKQSKDGRTNEYRLTDEGRRVLRAGSERFATVDGETGGGE